MLKTQKRPTANNQQKETKDINLPVIPKKKKTLPKRACLPLVSDDPGVIL